MTMTDGTITVRGLQSAVALVTAQAAGLEVPQAQILGETPIEEALQALTVLAATVMNVTLPSATTGVLRSTATMVARWEADQP